MEIGQLVLLMLVGCVGGILNVMAGGGSLIVMPLLYFMGLDGPLANGTNRVAILAQNFTAVASFFRKGYSDLKLSLFLTACALPGTALGAYLGTKLAGVWFERVLAGVMVGVMVLMATDRKPKVATHSTAPAATLTPRRYALAGLLMVVAGFYGGFIQAGVGFILMAILHRVLGLDLVRVNMHKVFIVGGYTVVALAIFAARGQVNWTLGLVLAVGNALGGYLGSLFTIAKGEKWIRIVLNVALAAMVIKLLLG